MLEAGYEVPQEWHRRAGVKTLYLSIRGPSYCSCMGGQKYSESGSLCQTKTYAGFATFLCRYFDPRHQAPFVKQRHIGSCSTREKVIVTCFGQKWHRQAFRRLTVLDGVPVMRESAPNFPVLPEMAASRDWFLGLLLSPRVLGKSFLLQL